MSANGNIFFTDHEGINCSFDDVGLCGYIVLSKNGYLNKWTRINQFSGPQYPKHFLATHNDSGKDCNIQTYSLVFMTNSGKGYCFLKHFLATHTALK